MCGWIMNALHAVGVDNLHPYDLLSRIAYLASRLSPLASRLSPLASHSEANPKAAG